MRPSTQSKPRPHARQKAPPKPNPPTAQHQPNQNTHQSTVISSLKFITFNCEGIIRNQICTSRAIEAADVACIQEHHLSKFEKAELKERFPGSGSDSKCHDEYKEVEPTHRAVGKHGVATFWKPHLSPFIKKSPEGSERILVTTLQIPSARPICIINAYMPSGVSAEAVDEFHETIDIVHELLLKYEPTHNLFLGGDINADFVNRKGRKEELMKRLIEEHKLRDLGANIQHKSTYINLRLGHASHLDHILIKSHNPQQWSECSIITEEDDMNATNVSTHFPVHCTLTLPEHEQLEVRKKPKQNKTTKTIYKWKERDQERYQEALDDLLNDMMIDDLNPFHATEVFQRCIHTAQAMSTPAVEKTTKYCTKRT